MSEYVKINDTVRFGVAIHNPSGGALIDADETPQWYVFEDGTDSVLLNGNFSKRAGLDGTYYSSFSASAANGFNAQSYYEVHASGTVNSIIGRAIVKTFVVEDLITVSVTGVPNVNIVSVSGLPTNPVGSIDANISSADAGVAVSVTGVVDSHLVSVIAGLPGISGGQVDVDSIADAVWDEQIGGHLSAGTFGSGVNALNQDMYFAAIKLVRDETNTQDEYSVCWFKNDSPLASSDISNPALSVFDTRTGSAVFENQTLTFASSKGVTFYDDTALRIASGEPYLVEASGLIDSATRTWKTIVGIDVY